MTAFVPKIETPRLPDAGPVEIHRHALPGHAPRPVRHATHSREGRA